MSTDKCYHFLLVEFTHAIQQSFKLSMWPNHRIEDILAKRYINASKKSHLVRILNKFHNQYTGQAFILLKHCNEQVILPEYIKCSKSGIQKIWKWPEILSVKVACVFPTEDIKCVKNIMMRYQCQILFNSLWPMKCPSICNLTQDFCNHHHIPVYCYKNSKLQKSINFQSSEDHMHDFIMYYSFNHNFDYFTYQLQWNSLQTTLCMFSHVTLKNNLVL